MGIVAARCIMGDGGPKELTDAYPAEAEYDEWWETDPDKGAGAGGYDDAFPYVGAVGSVGRRREGGCGCEEEYGWEVCAGTGH
jgi:hypothetical protein